MRGSLFSTDKEDEIWMRWRSRLYEGLTHVLAFEILPPQPLVRYLPNFEISFHRRFYSGANVEHGKFIRVVGHG
jgi:hypothetical protein